MAKRGSSTIPDWIENPSILISGCGQYQGDWGFAGRYRRIRRFAWSIWVRTSD